MATLRRKANKAATTTLNEAEEGIDNLRSAKSRANRRYGPQVDEAENSIEQMAENAGRQLRETYEAGVDELSEGADMARKAVARNPLLALAGAFVGGVVAATLLRR